MQGFIWPLVGMGSLGLLFGGLLAFASQKFAVETDPRADAVVAVLPGANCGACGYPGCSNYAKAVAEGEAIDKCTVGGSAVATKIAAIMGVESTSTGSRNIARVLCKGGDNCKNDFQYQGIESCYAMNIVSGGPKSCKNGCLGCGDCIDACKFGAIVINDYGVAQINQEKCVGCRQCVMVCPKQIIEMIPFEQNTFVDCKNRDKGGDARKMCTFSCIACKMCEKACKFDAIHVEGNVAKIDYEKCTDCMECYKVCPTHAISVNDECKKVAVVLDEQCIGCTICAKNCPVDAIEGAVKKIHKVDPETCIGCSVCFNKCPKDAIEMQKRC